jgi:hypothetical protein
MRIKRIILQQPTALATNFPSALVDEGRGGVESMELVGCVVKVTFSDSVYDPVVIPLSNVTCLIPDKESPEALVEALETAPAEAPRRKGKSR